MAKADFPNSIDPYAQGMRLTLSPSEWQALFCLLGRVSGDNGGPRGDLSGITTAMSKCIGIGPGDTWEHLRKVGIQADGTVHMKLEKSDG